jgi:hypothetical protein
MWCGRFLWKRKKERNAIVWQDAPKRRGDAERSLQSVLHPRRPQKVVGTSGQKGVEMMTKGRYAWLIRCYDQAYLHLLRTPCLHHRDNVRYRY